MIRKSITFTDFNGKTVTEDHYFHLSKNQLLQMEYSHEGGLSKILPEMIKAENIPKILELFTLIIRKSHGTRSEDGRNFIRDSPEEAEAFLDSPAFDKLFTELISSPEASAEFVGGIIPSDLSAQVKAQEAAELTTSNSQQPSNVRPWDGREPTEKELMEMSQEDLLKVYRRKTSP